MKYVSIVAENAAAALAQIHQQLGPEAVVLNVRKLPANGISRLWKQSGSIEVTAGLPEVRTREHVVSDDGDVYVPYDGLPGTEAPQASSPRRWRSIAWLESLGLLPALAEMLEAKMCSLYGDKPPVLPTAEWTLARETLATFWRPARPEMDDPAHPHVFIGPAGTGKTTVLCKWLTRSVLGDNRMTRVWRLDGETANTAEFLSLQCEMIGVEVERFWNGNLSPADLLFVDLPGVEPRNQAALTALQAQVATLPQPRVHLVLNAATETSLLFEQFHAFAPLLPADVIFTHLDEETRRVKLWNFVLGTNLPVSFLSAGQKIPGVFDRAESALLFPHQTSGKH